jgi:hypothetical protein
MTTASDRNKMHYDVMNVKAFRITFDASGNATIGDSPVSIPGVHSMTAEAEGDFQTYRADGIDYIVTMDNQGYNISFVTAQLSDDTRVSLDMETKDETTGITYEELETQLSSWLIVGEFKGDVHHKRFGFTNCTFGRTNLTGENKQPMRSPDEETLPVKATGLPVTINGQEKYVVKMSCVPGDPAYANWLTAPVLPGTAITSNSGTTPSGN